MQRLARANLVESTRGPGGGFTLSMPPEKISLLQVYESIDGQIGQPGCLLGRPACDGPCLLGGLLHKVNNDVRNYLGGIQVSALADAFPVKDA